MRNVITYLLKSEQWHAPLRDFAFDTGFSICLYDRDGDRCFGPFAQAPVSSFLADNKFWDEHEAGFNAEKGLLNSCRNSLTVQTIRMSEALEARCIPIFLKNELAGFIVFGWVPFEFIDPLTSQKLSKEISVSPFGLWEKLRQQAPASDLKFKSGERVLKIIAENLLSHLDAFRNEKQLSRSLKILNHAAIEMAAGTSVEDIAQITAKAASELAGNGKIRLFHLCDEGKLRPTGSAEDNSAVSSLIESREVTNIPIQARNSALLGLIEVTMPSGSMDFERVRDDIEALAAQSAVAFQKAELVRNLSKKEKHLRSSVEELQRLSRLRDEFLATVSHELRTPLNAIVGWSSYLSDSKSSEEDQREGIQAIQRNADAQLRIIEDLLDTSRIIAGKMPLVVANTDILEVLKEAVRTVRPSANAKSININLRLPPSPLFIVVDSNRMQQVFWNVLSNAVKFTPNEGQIVIDVLEKEKEILFVFEDNGRGIKREYLSSVFDRFSQEDSSTTRKFGGLGLGMAIVRHLIENHGGGVEVDSRGEGLGATFTISLPRPVGHDEGVHEKTEIAKEHAFHLDQLKILLVDDDPDALKILAKTLTRAGARVSTADSAHQAINLVQLDNPDLVVTDICMPNGDGYSLLEQIRSLPANEGGKTPAFAVTAFHQDVDKVRALKAGFLRHFQKPLNTNDFVGSIHEWMNLH